MYPSVSKINRNLLTQFLIYCLRGSIHYFKSQDSIYATIYVDYYSLINGHENFLPHYLWNDNKCEATKLKKGKPLISPAKCTFDCRILQQYKKHVLDSYKHLYQFSVLHNIVHISLQHVSVFIRPSSGVF
jgi:hypothetical protein